MTKLKNSINQAKTLYKNHQWQGRLLLTTFIILVVLLLIRASLSYTIIYSTVYWLNKQDISAHIDDISINIRKGTFTVSGASGTREGISVFNIGKASIDWAWRPLQKKTIHIRSIGLDDFKLDIEQYPDAIVIAGIVLKDEAGAEQQPAAEEDSVDWGTSLNRIDFTDVGFCFKRFEAAHANAGDSDTLIDYCGDIDKLTWSGDFQLGGADTGQQASGFALAVEGTLKISHLGLLNNKLEGMLVSIDDSALTNIKVLDINDIKLDSLHLSRLVLLQGAGHSRHKHAVAIEELKLGGIDARNTNTLSINTISVTRPAISMARDATGKFKYEQWLPPSEASSESETIEVQDETADEAAFNIRLGSINISEPEICFQQAASDQARLQALDYCLNLAAGNWKGNIAVQTPAGAQALSLSAAGDLDISGLVTSNKLLDRDLLTFDKLAIRGIDVKSLDDIAFGQLDLDNLNGLELIETEDSHTTSLAHLGITTLSYSNNAIAIETAALKDLGLHIILNKDGSMDFQKWKPATTEPESATQESKAGTETKPLKFKIGKFTLDSNRIIGFTDLSVTPGMQAGVKQLHFSISKLDTEKPQQQSPLELSAETTRHGTIELKGVAMPFESKPSFDATGKITGFNLRVVSPRAEQAIGHIIKSGQMDADLTLLSEQGQLNSNIALVLHHFNLKAKSKEDAAELDATFGMPINQSLKLLKDKKDRIKLDIPITGDINNPEFDPTDAIIKATAKATTVTLITFYTPYGLAYAGGNILFDLATALNFDPLLFEPGSSSLTDAHTEQLGKLGSLLTERPAVHLTLCGFTNLKDRETMFTEIIDKEKIKPPSKERLQKLDQLGNERQQKVKDHLVTNGKIEHNRLILCAPEHNDDTDSIAGVEISI